MNSAVQQDWTRSPTTQRCNSSDSGGPRRGFCGDSRRPWQSWPGFRWQNLRVTGWLWINHIQWINMLIHEPMVISGLTSEYHYQLITGSYDGKSILVNPLMIFNWLLLGHIIRNGQ